MSDLLPRNEHIDVEQMVGRIVMSANVRVATGIRLIRMSVPPDAIVPVLNRAARALQQLGFVAVRADAGPPRDTLEPLLHRHLVLFWVREGIGRRMAVDSTAAWIRRLAAVSVRSHLLVVLDSSAASATWQADARSHASIARERPLAATVATAPLKRADTYLRQGRAAAAERWLRAAVHTARRHTITSATSRAQAQVRLVRHLIDVDRWDEARRLAIDTLEVATDWPDRLEAGPLAARTLVVAGQLQRAETLLRSIVTEAATRDARPALALRLALVELFFWQGRIEEAVSELDGLEDDVDDVRVWRGLTSWATGDAIGLARACPHVPRSSWLRRVIRAEQLIGTARWSDACRALQFPAELPRSSLPHMVASWMIHTCSGRESAGVPRLRQLIDASGARGVLRWGLGRRPMSLLHGVMTLLQVIHDADDEDGALRGACAWICQETAAAGVAILDLDGTRIIAGTGIEREDLDRTDVREAVVASQSRTLIDGPDALVTSRIRYARAPIGVVLLRGRRESAGTLAEAAVALASACAAAMRARLDALACAGSGESLASDILGRSPAIVALREAIARASGTTFPVLIEGESGTGKELVARALHRLSARRDRRFAALNCAALTDELIEAELFGHARGAFTGAVNSRTGLFEEANGGTLFLDEVSELSPRGQAKLLRVLQEREIRRVGEHAVRPVDVRVLAATNLGLADAVARGRFRDDLRFRLAVVRIHVTPLRDRIEDVPLLAQAFWRLSCRHANKHALLGPDAIAALCRHHWPGNVRELQNVVAALVVAAPTRGRVTARHVAQVLAPPDGDLGTEPSLETARQAFERRVVSAALARHGGRQARAARELGLSRQGLAKAMKRLGLRDLAIIGPCSPI